MEAGVRLPSTAIESPTASFWRDDDGVINIIMNKHKQIHTAEEAEENVKVTTGITKGEPSTLLIDVTQIQSMTREAREVYKHEASTGHITAVALVTNSISGRILANFFMSFNRPSAPVKLFNDYDSAHAWLLSLKK